MRHTVLLLALPFLALAGCGGGGGNSGAGSNYDQPGGGFDRARFRADTLAHCRNRVRDRSDVPDEMREIVCDCVAGTLLDGNDDAALRAMVRDEALAVRRNDQALARCSGGSGGSFSGPLDEELPPPPELPPPTPPATASGEIADGPDTGAGASAPGGARARSVRGLGSYLSADDYPAAALRNNEQGVVTFQLDVEPTGRVGGCQVLQSSGSATLDSTTCRIMRSRVRYMPARNARGEAVADRDRAVVRWALPSG